jgi:hypothetical protein
VVELRWIAYDADGTATVQLYASREALSGWSDPGGPEDVRVSMPEFPVQGSPDRFRWDVSHLGPGCYQPYALVADDMDLVPTWSMAPGKLTVPGTGWTPPSVWLLNGTADRVDASGRLRVRYRVHDPDSPTTVSLKYRRGEQMGPIADGLSLPAGGGSLRLRREGPGAGHVRAACPGGGGGRAGVRGLWRGGGLGVGRALPGGKPGRGGATGGGRRHGRGRGAAGGGRRHPRAL